MMAVPKNTVHGAWGAVAPLAPGDEASFEIIDLAFGGRGVARASGLVVFVQGALPGEAVRARIVRRRRGYAEAICVEVLRPSPDRFVPPCEHYGVCGGCDLQHLAPAAQARAKGLQVGAMLAHLAGVQVPTVCETVVAGPPVGYRFRMDFDWGADAGGRPALGLHHRERRGEIVPIRRCHLMSDEGNEIRAWIAAEAPLRHLQPWDRRRRRGLLQRFGIQMATSTGEILVTLDTGRGDSAALIDLVGALTRRFSSIVGVVRRQIGPQGRRGVESILAGRGHLYEDVEGDRFKIPAGAFFQSNRHALAPLRAEVIGSLGPRPHESILELYCGVGLFTLALARRARDVTGVEGSRVAAAAARDNAARAGVGNFRLCCRDVSAVLPGLLEDGHWDAILLDPPRAGLARHVARCIALSRVPRLVYVSCDPATLARDVKIFVSEGGFGVERVRPFDLFPQTHHVESVVRLSRRTGGGPPGVRA